MGAVIGMCNCSLKQPIFSNLNQNIQNEGINLENAINSDNKNDNNNIEPIINKKKKISNGVVVNNDQSNDAETLNNNISSNRAQVIAQINKIELNNSQKVKKRGKKSKKEIDKKNNKLKSHDGSNNNEQEYENMSISDTIISELIITEKIKTITKEKKKKIKGRNYINIVLIGYNEVGKSSFCIRLVENKFEDFYIPSICNENFSKMMVYNDRNYKVNFLVILGEEKNKKQDNEFITADFFLFLYDITKIMSFNKINLYLKQLKKYLCFYDKEGKNPNFCVLGNKSDLEGERKINIEIINKCIQKYNIKHFDISIKTGKNVNNIIQNCIQIFDKISFSNN